MMLRVPSLSTIGKRSCLAVLLGSMCFTGSLVAFADDPAAEPEGPIVNVGPDKTPAEAPQKERPVTPPTGDPASQRPDYLKFWLGIACENPSDVLRAHVSLPEGVGLVLTQILDNSPAKEAGLEQFDIVVMADGKPIHNLQELNAVVWEHGEQKTALKLDIVRHGEATELSVTPSERPAEYAQAPMQPGDARLRGLPEGDLQQLEARMREMIKNRPLPIPQGPAFRAFPPDFEPQFGLGPKVAVPSGVSISVSKRNDEPTQVTISRGGETWTLSADQPEEIKKLPVDLQDLAKELLDVDQPAEAAKPADRET